jgi:hypothetical protein
MPDKRSSSRLMFERAKTSSECAEVVAERDATLLSPARRGIPDVAPAGEAA